ncbi:MAG: response regulator [Merismopedia sp. SIO2A8]|nr:response regulator [Merismopedia sp. SIO2A8]
MLVLKRGEITFCGPQLPSPQDFVIEVGKRLRKTWIESSLRVALEQCSPQPSVSEILEILTRLRIFQWEELETLMYVDTIHQLELVAPFAGSIECEEGTPFDLSFGRNRHALDWERLWSQVKVRQKMWSQMSGAVPSVDAIPSLAVDSLDEVDDIAARKHLQKWVDGKRSLLDIAELLGDDPLILGRKYASWTRLGWLNFSEQAVVHTPIILSVDDSAMVQSVLKHTLGKHYQMRFANNAMDALTMLNMHDVGLLLLDVTMPDINGLELCRVIRKIPKFKQLPIVMLTANDGFVDKVKGQFSGSNHYLTKPVDQDRLCQVIDQYVVPFRPGLRYVSKPLMTRRSSEILTASLLRMATKGSSAFQKFQHGPLVGERKAG